METTSLRIKEIMKKKKVTQRMLAANLGVTPSAIYQMLDSNNMSVGRLAQIAEILDVNVRDLFEDSEVHYVKCPYCLREHPIRIKIVVSDK